MRRPSTCGSFENDMARAAARGIRSVIERSAACFTPCRLNKCASATHISLHNVASSCPFLMLSISYDRNHQLLNYAHLFSHQYTKHPVHISLGLIYKWRHRGGGHSRLSWVLASGRLHEHLGDNYRASANALRASRVASQCILICSKRKQSPACGVPRTTRPVQGTPAASNFL
jgi:hypothetical protein